MSLRTRVEKLEQRQGAKVGITPMTSGFDKYGPTDTIEQWQVACKLINAEYAMLKQQAKTGIRHRSRWHRSSWASTA
jgi:hypothetical protein